MTKNNEMNAQEISNRVAQLYQEYKQIQYEMRSKPLPLGISDSRGERLMEISRECWTYGVNIKKFV